MLVAAAVCPHPPLIAPEVAGAAAPELDDLRDACASAIRSLAASRPDTLVVVGDAEATRSYGPDAGGSLAPWGAAVRVGPGDPVLPLSLTIGRLLLDLAGSGAPSGYQAVAADAPVEACSRLGAALAGRGRRVALLVMGDGSARLTVKSPGYFEPGALPYNEALARALGGADAPALADLDPEEAAELWVAGRAAFQVLAGAALAGREATGHAAGAGQEDSGSGFLGELLYDGAPYGVGYLVARWSRRDPS
ncbi:class III extradiol dioxygenase subunit B-like domain-containing protein [Sphaerisporangium sp. NBC_01403]|uniref:class III extradiol dioxygenase subunit B-like domain-containing protein n=1 Tax=Sphaerisporangium sp. NBC_01403 TaxID=2903599 RepID=UPI003255F973